MLDMSETTKAKSDQLNAVDLLGAPKTITITKVSKVNDDKQPIFIDYEGGEGRPYKPCLGMRRGLVALWGLDGEQYVGRKLTLFCNPSVKYAGKEEGGIQISHASHIDKPVKFKLVLTRGKSTMHKVEPLEDTTKPKASVTEEDFIMWCEAFEACNDMGSLSGVGAKIKASNYDADSSKRLKAEYTKAAARIRDAEEKEGN